MRDKVTRQCSETTIIEEKGEPKRIRTEVPLLPSLTPYRWAKPAHWRERERERERLTLKEFSWERHNNTNNNNSNATTTSTTTNNNKQSSSIMFRC